MKVAIITDTHAGARSDNVIFNEYFIRFFETQFFPYLKEHNIKHVIHLGDVFDRRKYVNFQTLSSWQKRVFEPLNSLVDQVDIIVGNHDTYFKNTNAINSVQQILPLYDKFRIYAGPQEITLDKLKVLLVPWICEDNVDITVKMIEETDAKICMGHLEIMGFEMHSGHINEDKGIKRDIFDKFFMTLTGHFHHKSSKGGVHYLGSPYPIIWSDWGDSRGFHVLDTDTMELEFIENPKQIFHKIYYDDAKETFESLVNQDYSSLQGLFVKVVVHKKTNPYWFDQFIEKLHSVNPADVSIVEGIVESDDSETSLDEAKDTLTILMEYVKALGLEAHEQELSTLLRELYIEALNSNESIQG